MQVKHFSKSRTPSGYARIDIAVLTVLIILIALYSLLRYGGLWGETDTRAATRAIHTMVNSGKLVTPNSNDVYPNGYAYQVISVFLMLLGNLDLSSLQRFGSSLLMIWIVFPAWLAYRELTDSRRGATLATVLLFIQPEFLFVIMRGTHEKFTRGLMLLCIYLFVRSLNRRGTVNCNASLIILFYVFIFAMISLNNLISTSFLLGMVLSLAIIAVSGRLGNFVFFDRDLLKNKTTYAVLTMLVISFLFTFYAYPPALHQLDILSSVGDRLVALTLEFSSTQAAEASTIINPYSTWVAHAWLNTPVYFLVSIANWILLGASCVIWIVRSYQWLYRKYAFRELSEYFLWVFFGAYMLQGLISVAVDVSGAIDGNLQHRLFPSFVMFAAPLVARWFVDSDLDRNIVFRSIKRYSLLFIGIITLLSIAKATNEPIVSNKWLFYTNQEINTLFWANDHLKQRSVWLEYDERLSTAVDMLTGGKQLNISRDQSEPEPATHDFLFSNVTLSRSMRQELPIPFAPDSFITYDNGEAQIYHLRPSTPYQK